MVRRGRCAVWKTASALVARRARRPRPRPPLPRVPLDGGGDAGKGDDEGEPPDEGWPRRATLACTITPSRSMPVLRLAVDDSDDDATSGGGGALDPMQPLLRVAEAAAAASSAAAAACFVLAAIGECGEARGRVRAALPGVEQPVAAEAKQQLGRRRRATTATVRACGCGCSASTRRCARTAAACRCRLHDARAPRDHRRLDGRYDSSSSAFPPAACPPRPRLHQRLTPSPRRARRRRLPRRSWFGSSAAYNPKTRAAAPSPRCSRRRRRQRGAAASSFTSCFLGDKTAAAIVGALGQRRAAPLAALRLGANPEIGPTQRSALRDEWGARSGAELVLEPGHDAPVGDLWLKPQPEKLVYN